MEGILFNTGSWVVWFGGLVLLLVAGSGVILGYAYEEEVRRIRESIWVDFPLPPEWKSEVKQEEFHEAA